MPLYFLCTNANSQLQTYYINSLVSAGHYEDQNQYPLPGPILMLFFVIICLVIGSLMPTPGLSSDIPWKLEI